MEFDMNTLRGIITLLAMIFFIAICWAVFSKHNKPKYDQASKMALENGDNLIQEANNDE